MAEKRLNFIDREATFHQGLCVGVTKSVCLLLRLMSNTSFPQDAIQEAVYGEPV